MKTVTIVWTETVECEMTVNVPDSFDARNPIDWDLENDLASISEEAFQGLTRDVQDVVEEEFDEDATAFSPTRR